MPMYFNAAYTDHNAIRPGIRVLNLLLLLPLLTASINGLDSSLVNGTYSVIHCRTMRSTESSPQGYRSCLHGRTSSITPTERLWVRSIMYLPFHAHLKRPDRSH